MARANYRIGAEPAPITLELRETEAGNILLIGIRPGGVVSTEDVLLELTPDRVILCGGLPSEHYPVDKNGYLLTRKED